MKKLEQTIKCDVNNCRYNDDLNYLCTLNSIDVSCTCDGDTCKNKKETVCNSFKEK